MTESYSLTTTLWIWSSDKAPASWHFLTIGGEAAEAIHATMLMRRLEGGRRRGWGSVRVTATIGETRWQTSIFPAKESGGYLLPVKADVRKAEGLIAGDSVQVTVTV
jgi:hypothetical protein